MATTLAGPAVPAQPHGGRAHWAGTIVTTLPVLFLVFDSVIKLIVIRPVVTAFAELGYPISLAPTIGLIELACLAVYLVRQTSLGGAILLTGFLGGAIASHTRIGSPLLSHTLFPIYIGVLLWGGLLLRDVSLRAFLLGRHREVRSSRGASIEC